MVETKRTDAGAEAMDLESMMTDDAATPMLPSDEKVMDLNQLVGRKLALEDDVVEMELGLAALRNELKTVTEVDIPEKMLSLGVKSIRMADGALVEVKSNIHASITKDNREAAFEWLRRNGHDGIIRNEVKCGFGKGQDQDAERLQDLLKEAGYSFESEQTVHPSTLKAFVKQQLELGLDVPREIFSVHEVSEARIKR